MPRGIFVCVAAVAVTVAIAVTTAASGRSDTASITLHARSQVEHARFVDNAPAGRSAGDQLVFTERLLDARGRRLGRDAASCTLLFDARSLCTGTYILRRGQLMVQLVQPGPSGSYRQAITGGTGRYARASGTVTVDQRAGGDRFTFHIHTSAR
jgi:hypothetical protein